MPGAVRKGIGELLTSAVFERLKGSGDSDLAPRLATGAFWSLLGGMSSQVMAFLASVWVARQLGGEQFGEFAMIRNTAMMLSILGAFGIGMTATKHVAEYRRDSPVRAGRIVCLSEGIAVFCGGSMAMLLCVIASPLARHGLHAPHLAGMLRIGAFLLVFNTVIFAQSGVLAGFEAFKEMTRVGVIAGGVTLVALVVASSIAGLQGAIWGAVIGLGTHCILNQAAVRYELEKRSIPFAFSSCLNEWRILGSFSFPVALSNMVRAPAFWACQSLLVSQVGGYAQMGVFNVAHQWRMATLYIPERVSQMALPILSSLKAEGRSAEFRRTLRVSLMFNLGVSILLAVPVMVLSRWIVRAYGKDFAGGASALTLLAGSAILVSASIVGERALVSLGKVWQRLIARLCWCGVLLGCAYWLVSNGGGASGLALAVVLACGFHVLAVFGLLSWSTRDEVGLPASSGSMTPEAEVGREGKGVA